jgi:hypothetical protein
MSLALTTTHENPYFQRSIPPIFVTLLSEIVVCNYRYINQLYGQSQKAVSKIKVSFVRDWRVNETY